MYYFSLLAYLFSLGAAFPSYEKTIQFSILHKGEKVGELNATRTSQGLVEHYRSVTKTTTRIITKITVEYEYNVNLLNGRIQSSSAFVEVNQRPHKETSIQKTGDQYQVEMDGRERACLDYPIYYATVMLLFQEPVYWPACISEQEGVFHPLKSLGNHRYQKTNSKGRISCYNYENGKLVSAEIDSGLVEFEIIRID